MFKVNCELITTSDCFKPSPLPIYGFRKVLLFIELVGQGKLNNPIKNLINTIFLFLKNPNIYLNVYLKRKVTAKIGYF